MSAAATERPRAAAAASVAEKPPASSSSKKPTNHEGAVLSDETLRAYLIFEFAHLGHENQIVLKYGGVRNIKIRNIFRFSKKY